MNKTSAAKQFSEQYISLKEGEKNNFSRIVNKLLQVNYITRRKPGDTNDYRFILAYKELFQAYFQIADFILNIYREDEVVCIENENLFNHMRLRKTESILLLVIRIIYQRKMDFVTLDENVEIYLHEIHSELTRIGFLDHKRITKDRLKPALSFLRAYNIIDYIDRGLHDDARIKIYPTVLYVTNLDSIKEVVQKLESYAMEGGGEADEETDED
jgi:excinuclease UvrABC helicase subunit UvrB